MLATLRNRFDTWLFRPQIERGTVTLVQRRIFILPTRHGFALAGVLLVMLLGDINYSLNLGYVLTFLLAMMAMMSMLHTFRNLARLEIRAGRAEPVFSGEQAGFELYFRNPDALARYQLSLRNADGTVMLQFDLAVQHEQAVIVPLPATQRGWLPLGRLTLYSEFPLGLFHAWAYLHFDAHCLVYPKPLPAAVLPPGDAPDGTGRRIASGDDDFAGLRKYVAGDAMPRIAWKAFARARELQVKQFSAVAGDELWLDYAAAPDRSEEQKLARLARWVLDAEAQGLRYGLRLPDGEQSPGSGAAQRAACLRRLALFNLPQERGQT